MNMESRGFRILIWLLISAVIVILDLWTKHLASNALTLYRPEPVFPWLNMTLAHNQGAAFSFLSDASGWQRWVLSGLALVVSVVIVIWLIRLPRNESFLGVALALILGGAVGNLVDRVQLGYVVDFIDVHYQGWHWPAFNIADSAITVGVVLMIWDALFLAKKRNATA